MHELRNEADGLSSPPGIEAEFSAYFGTYTVDPEQKVVVHQVAASLSKAHASGEIRRNYELNEDALTLNFTRAWQGVPTTYSLEWKRISTPGWWGSDDFPGHGKRPKSYRLGDVMTGILGYARVSTSDQDVAGQSMRLTEAGAIKVFTDVRSGRTMDRPGLVELLAYARNGDTLAVVRLDRLGRSLAELLATVTMLKERGIALLSLEEKIDTSSAAGELVFHVFGAIAPCSRNVHAPRCYLTTDAMPSRGAGLAERTQPARPGIRDSVHSRGRARGYRKSIHRWRRGASQGIHESRAARKVPLSEAAMGVLRACGGARSQRAGLGVPQTAPP
jgi:hypothetical protein